MDRSTSEVFRAWDWDEKGPVDVTVAGSASDLFPSWQRRARRPEVRKEMMPSLTRYFELVPPR